MRTLTCLTALVALAVLFAGCSPSGGGGGGGGVPTDNANTNANDNDSDGGGGGGAALAAFPGAEGFGAQATGGRGGRVVYVTNLNADGEGSLQWALDQSGPRYILFKVSGVIDASIHLQAGDVTIAGQTSPGGIIIRGLRTDETPFIDGPVADTGGVMPDSTVSNFIIRHLRSRPALDNPSARTDLDEDALRIRRAANGIVDHCSLANAYDETIELSMSHDITVQNCVLAENTGGNSPFGGFLVQYTDPDAGFELDRISIHHNCWNRIITRCPAIHAAYARESPRMQIEVSNNLFWDTAFFMEPGPLTEDGGFPIRFQLNCVGNYGYQRADAPADGGGGYTYGAFDSQFLVDYPDESTTYFSDNRINLYPDVSDYQLVYCCNDYPTALAAGTDSLPFPDNTAPGPFARETRHDFPEITYHDGSEMRDVMIADAGAFPRDPMDRRLLSPVETGSIESAARNVNPVGDTFTLDFPADAPPAAPVDTDEDGMPDDWETLYGLDPSTQDHNGTDLSMSMTGVAGYTNLECYLNQLAEQRVNGS